ncbi:MAG: sulfite exporter TauE/SafE family protein [Cytophagales bacterium]|nr:sulfite exporter TauE/SafE family protein [Cytophagales bacterium]
MTLDFLAEYNLTQSDWLWLAFCAMCVGMAKTGLSGLGMLIVPIMASVLGAKASTGFLLPMLIMGDIFGVIYYHRHAEMKYILRLAPSTIIGVLTALAVGEWVSEGQFQQLLSIVILGSMLIMIFRKKSATDLTESMWMTHLMGFLGGFTTMIGNAAGPVMSIYFLSRNLPKNSFIGTSAWFFLLVNVFKVPFHIGVWETISMESFSFNLLLFPAIVLGVFIGFSIVKRIPEKAYRIFILVSIGLAALKLFF